MTLDGNPSVNKARLMAQKFCGSKNIMVMKIETDETKLSVSPEDFIAHSHICEEGVSYGREFVTQTFKLTSVWGFYLDTEKGMQKFHTFYEGETTESKLLNKIREWYGNTAIITDWTVSDERRYMKREEYLELAKS